MRSQAEQIKGLNDLAMLVSKHECNTMLSTGNDGDVAYLQAANTPRPSQICFASGGYVVWKWTPQGYMTDRLNLTAPEAARVVVAEYIAAKAARVKALYPEMDMKEIATKLMDGYQNRPVRIVVTLRRNRP